MKFTPTFERLLILNWLLIPFPQFNSNGFPVEMVPIFVLSLLSQSWLTLKKNKFGYLVPVGDKFAMSNAIIKALDKPISKELLEEAIKPFNENVIVNRHIELINANR